MRSSEDYKTTPEASTIAEEENQIDLFDNSIKSPLKYQRRKKRVISGTSFLLTDPSEATSKKMQSIKSSGTSIEQKLATELLKQGINYTSPSLLIGNIEGKPDFVIPRYKIAIFCDGDFWHGHDQKKIKNNQEFWESKIQKNIVRDHEVNNTLLKNSWVVFRFWGKDINNNVGLCVEKVKNYMVEVDSKRNLQRKFTFVDLFSGIGGFRIALEELGGKCLAFSEIDRGAIQTYKKNYIGYRDAEIELGSITNVGKLPFKDIDLIVGGVPCQSWSVAGKMRGFDDPRGRLWYDTIRVVKENKPKAFIFENVKGLIDPRNKESLDLILESFRSIGYKISYKLLNSYDFGLPQNRDRIFIVGYREDIKSFKEFKFPKPLNRIPNLSEFIENITFKISSTTKKTFDPKEIFGSKIPMSRNRFQKLDQLNDFFILCDTRNGHTTIHSWDIIKTTKREKEICLVVLRNRRKKVYGNSDGNPLSFLDLKQLIPDIKKEELDALIDKNILKETSGGFGFVNSKNSAGINGIYRIYLPKSNTFSTLTATGTKDVVATIDINATSPLLYKETFIKEVINKRNYRSITAKECGKLQGFPSWFAIDENDSLAKKQFGNAVSTNVIYYLADAIIKSGIFEKTYERKRKKRDS